MTTSSTSTTTLVGATNTCDSSSSTGQYNIEKYDVLCYRGRESFNNIGNRRFRLLISSNISCYLSCKGRCERGRMNVSLTEELCGIGTTPGPGMRFFKRGRNNGELIQLDFKQCREKVAHALRDAASQQKNGNSSNSASNNKCKGKNMSLSKETIMNKRQQQQYHYQELSLSNNVLQNLNNDDVMKWMMSEWGNDNWVNNNNNNNNDNDDDNNNGFSSQCLFEPISLSDFE